MLYLIGLGVACETDISLKGLECIKHCDEVYTELYTNPFLGKLELLENRIGKEIRILERAEVEEKGEDILIKPASTKDIAFLVPGDPLAATTHIDLVLQAKKMGVAVKIIHSSSILSAIAETGLQLYKFGKTTSLPRFQKSYRPKTPYDILGENEGIGAHTLMLLDVDGEGGNHLTINDAIGQLLSIEQEEGKKYFTAKTKCIGAARLGEDSLIYYESAQKLMEIDFGPPPHCLIVPGKLHFIEEEMLATFSVPPTGG